MRFGCETGLAHLQSVLKAENVPNREARSTTLWVLCSAFAQTITVCSGIGWVIIELRHN
jgi:hypothetical protein